MRESVLTKKSSVSVMKPMRQMEVIPFYEDKLDTEMMEVLRTMQSPVDERRRVQQRVVNKHRYDSERQYWMERDARDNEPRILRKSMSLNDIQSYSGRHPRSYLEIHQQQMSDSAANSRANSSQDTYPHRQYPRGDVNSSGIHMVYHGSQPSSRLSMANVETPNRYDSSQFVRSESNNSYPVNNARRYSSQGPIYDDVYRNQNFSRANDMNVSRAEMSDSRKMSLPLPNIKPAQGGEQILVTMSPGRPDRVSIRMGPVPGISSSSAASSNQSFNKVQYNSSAANGPSGTNYSRQEGIASLKPSSSNSNSRNTSTAKMDKSQQNTSKMEKSVKRNNVKTESVEKMEKPASSQKRGSQTERSASSTRSNQPEWYNRIDGDGNTNTKDAERERKGNPTTANVAKTDKKVTTQNQTSARVQNVTPQNQTPARVQNVTTQNQTSVRVQNIPTQNKTPARVQTITNQQDRRKPIRRTTKEKKPQQSSLRKTNSFKVVGRSTNFFGFVSVADMKAKKKVTFSNDDSERPGTA